ncbi:hypothetical protein [Streptomyces olivochromogenes]|uniref:Uncharacterized protein n=1 Tax=Streptomyces olivochromogenes TaxID=1963 RepID=A0A250V809_STROL|nr:hypothetical protein [Streptomyces olivochromogenes]KUN45751.1 hypothetical protein AQJ27_19825 [Streptomyces olivochromogenes]GAX50301.1 hypothetical protein SO3561_01799 [Streptomyces olivochromogenes]
MRHSPGPLPRRATAYEKRTEPPRHLTPLIERAPAHSNTPGRDSDVLGPGLGFGPVLGSEIRGGGDQLGVRLVSQRDAAWVGALLAAVDAQQ